MNSLISKTRLIACAAVSAVLVVSASQPSAVLAQGAATQGDLAQAVGALRGISTLRADFVQTDRNGKRMGGVLTLKRPGRIRFQYEKGVPILVVSDGSALTFVDYSVRQVQRWPIKNSPLGALLDPNRDVMKYGRLVPVGNPNVVGIEVRDKGHPEYGIITLMFVRKGSAPGGLELSSWASLDSQNNRTVINLSNHRYGAAVPDNTFKFNDPRSATRR
ncbi:outer membrane lipoprotein carrier protein LolA [Novosphingobium sp.]|uniref:LolA family protein n=1 Tax=Novosphingobium sp. TaxID=1874826 RepID=UPI0025F59FDB|nr:outer membrane lipoprotein carrier protein LolA [Novosphingobium sp.]